MQRKVVVGAAALACVLGGLLWWMLRGRFERVTSAPSAGAVGAASQAPSSSAQPDDAPDDGAGVSAPPVQVIAADGVSDPTSRAGAVAKLDETIRFYRETMTYPLWSRPADASNEHLTRWNRPVSVEQVFAEDSAKREIEAFAEIDRVFAGPDEHLTLQVACRYLATRAPAPVDSVTAELQWRDPDSDQWAAVEAVPLQASASGWRAQVTPSQVQGLRGAVREVRLAVQVRRGEFSRELTLGFGYAVEAPVVVRGLSRDRVVAGSLELDLDVEVGVAAPVALWATLYAADGGKAIGVFEDRFFPAKPGRQTFTVRFFGKVLRDRGLDGPYRLGAIHGHQYRRELSPDQVLFARAEEPAIVTAAHPASGFSPNAYQGPEVAARLAHYEAVREALRAGRPPPPPPVFSPPATPAPKE